jgi:hypothetical protein
MKNLTALSVFVAALCVLAPEASAAGKQKGRPAAAKVTGNILGAKVEEGPRAARSLPSSAKDASKETSSAPPANKTPSVEVSKAEPKAESASDDKSPKLVSVAVQSDYPTAHLDTFVDGKLTTVCQLPCTRTLEVGKMYWVDGPGMVTSSRFTPSEDTKSFNVSGGSQVAKTTGFVLIVGASATLGAALGIGQASAKQGLATDTRKTLVTAAIGTFVASAVVAIPGLILWLTSGTNVKETKATGAAKVALSLATTGGISF